MRGTVAATSPRPLAFANRLMQAVPDEAEAAAGVRLPGIESCEQPHDSPGRLTRVAKANHPISHAEAEKIGVW